MYNNSNKETVPCFLKENYNLLGHCSGLKNYAVSLYKTGILESANALRNMTFSLIFLFIAY
jgi:hypothetical protein